MCVCVESLLKAFPADFTFRYCWFWPSFSRPSANVSKMFVCVSGVRAVWRCCLSVAQVTVCSATLLSERVISACSSSKIQPSIKRWRSARRFSKCMWQKNVYICASKIVLVSKYYIWMHFLHFSAIIRGNSIFPFWKNTMTTWRKWRTLVIYISLFIYSLCLKCFAVSDIL